MPKPHMCKGWQNISANVSRSHFNLHVVKCCSSLCTLRSLIMGSEVCVVQLTQGLNVVGSCGVLLRIFTSSSNCFLLKMSSHSGNIHSCPYLYNCYFSFLPLAQKAAAAWRFPVWQTFNFCFLLKVNATTIFAISVKKILKFAKQINSLVSL